MEHPAWFRSAPNFRTQLNTLRQDMHEIYDRVFLGSAEATRDITRLKEKGITHILTVEYSPLPPNICQDFEYKFVKAEDMCDQDLLCYFEECYRFIEQGRGKGGILVHCWVGVSRSATIAIAYLMKKCELTVDQAMEKIKQVRLISPNPGFITQLKMYESLNCELDESSIEFKQYRLTKLSSALQKGGRKFLPESALGNDPMQTTEQATLLYKCKKCRRPVFKSANALPHSPGKGETAFDWRAKLQSNSEQQPKSSSESCSRTINIEPMKWMESSILTLSGKILCPKCSAKLGSFTWLGEPCSCGTWVIPSFRIDKKKVDECRPLVLTAELPTSEKQLGDEVAVS